MLNDVFIATTAVSSFNNAALLNPFFFTMGLLSFPLFLMAFLYGRDFVSRFGWNNQNAESNTSLWSCAFLMLWILLFGGNYAVMRDGISLLPVLIAFVLFVLMVVVSNGLARLKYIEKLRDKKLKWLLFCMVIIGALFSGMMTWWGMLLQLSAIVCGAIVGCRLKKDISWISKVTLIFGVMTGLILMQPEYFRFGQLGNLTIIHLICILIAGIFAITTLTTRYIHARGRIRQSAYIKLKWLFRIIALLAFVLFISTESVPVFIGLVITVGLLESLSIYHGSKLPENMFKQSWALLIFCLGIITVCPVISAIGIVYLSFISGKIKVKDFLRLL